MWNKWIAEKGGFTVAATVNAIELNCPAPVVLVGNANPGKDPVVSVHVYRYGDTGLWYITYRLSSGATISRGDQYDMKTVPYGRTSYWTGTLKSNPAVVDSGAIFGPSASGGYRYHETIRKDGQIIVEMEARECVRVDNVSPPVASNSPSIRTVIPMLQEGGTFVVPTTINRKLTLDFIVDSGAADVSIPADVVMTLIRTGTITDADFLGKEIFKMADGSTVPPSNS